MRSLQQVFSSVRKSFASGLDVRRVGRHCFRESGWLGKEARALRKGLLWTGENQAGSESRWGRSNKS